MRPAENIEKLIKNLSDKTSDKMDERVRKNMLQALAESEKPSALPWPNIRKIITKNPTTKLAAAVIVTAAVLLINIWDKSIPATYALEQTIKANHTVRYLHIKNFDSSHNETEQFWLEFDESGQPVNARMEFARTPDGPKVSVLNQDTGHVWFKAKNLLITVKDRDDIVAKHILMMVEQFDPKLMVERLHEAEKKHKVKLEITEPSSRSEPILVTVIYPLKNGKPSRRDVLTVDPATKLITKRESYHLINGEYQLHGLQEFLKYNKVIDPKIFTIDAPDDVILIDQTIQEIGLSKGDLSDKEIAVQVARQFFEALIIKDYAEAGRLCEGMPANWVKQQFGKTNFLSIISVEEPTPHPDPATRFLCVPCEIEVETEGVRSTKKFVPNIRPVYSDPDRWTIGGGIP